jgi:multidrug resistance efflux pump
LIHLKFLRPSQNEKASQNHSSILITYRRTGRRSEEIRKSQAQVEEARFVLEELENGSQDQEIPTAEVELNQATAAQQTARSRLEPARADHKRCAALVREGAISRQSFETYETGLKSAETAYQEALAGVRSARERLSLLNEGPRSEQICQAQTALCFGFIALAVVKFRKTLE